MIESLLWLVPITVAIAGCFSGALALIVLVAALPLFGSPPGGPYLAALDVAAIVALLAVALRRRQRRTPSALDIAVAAFAAVSIASLWPLAWSPPSISPRVILQLVRHLPAVQSWTTLYAVRAAINLVIGVGLYLAIQREFRHRGPQALLNAIAAGLTFVLVIGFLEQAGGLSLDHYRAIDRQFFATRMHSLFFHSGWFSEYLVLVGPIAVVAGLGRGGIRGTAAVVVGLSTLFAIVLTQQRGAWVAAAVMTLAMLAWGARALLGRPHRLQVVSGVAVMAMFTGLLVLARPDFLAPVIERARTGTRDMSGRSSLWMSALEIATERPLLGVGLGGFAPAYDALIPLHSPWHIPTRATPHNTYASILSERGIIGVLAALLVALATGSALGRMWRSDDPEQQRYGHAFTLAAIGFLVYGLTQYMLYLKATEWLCWIGLGLLASLDRSATEPSRRWRRLAAGLSLTAVVLAGIRALALVPVSTQGSASFGFHEAETTDRFRFRWSEDYAAMRVARGGDRLDLEFANGHPLASRHPVWVTVTIDGRAQAPMELREGWESRTYALDASDSASVLIEVSATPTFRPFADLEPEVGASRSGDIRRLGVAMTEPRFDDAPP